MSFKNTIFVSVAVIFVGQFLVNCSPDSQTPPSKVRDSYVHAKMNAAPSATLKCGDDTYILPASQQNEELGRYLLLLQAANSASSLATMSVAKMQKLYRDCIRPAVFERVTNAPDN